MAGESFAPRTRVVGVTEVEAWYFGFSTCCRILCSVVGGRTFPILALKSR